MSAEAAGLALFDALYRKQAFILGDEAPHAAGERFLAHLARRGYTVRYDPSVIEELPEGVPVRVERLELKPLPEEAVALAEVKTFQMDGRDVRCDCGCWTFHVYDNIATCTGCKATYRITED